MGNAALMGAGAGGALAWLYLGIKDSKVHLKATSSGSLGLAYKKQEGGNAC